MSIKIPIETSARHIHVSQEDFQLLFGEDAQLHYIKELSQPGQYLCQERLTVKGPKGEYQNMAILGPFRRETQIELSLTDARKVGLDAPIRNSGDIAGSAGAKLIGPKGELELKEGIIIAARHVHLYPETAEKYGLKDGDIVDIQTEGERSVTLHNVLVRAGVKHADEVHIDTDEANACNLGSGVMVNIVYNK